MRARAACLEQHAEWPADRDRPHFRYQQAGATATSDGFESRIRTKKLSVRTVFARVPNWARATPRTAKAVIAKAAPFADRVCFASYAESAIHRSEKL